MASARRRARPRAGSRHGRARPECAPPRPCRARPRRATRGATSVSRDEPVALRVRSPRCSAAELHGTKGSGRPASVHEERVAAAAPAAGMPSQTRGSARTRPPRPPRESARRRAGPSPRPWRRRRSPAGRRPRRVRQQPAARRLQPFQGHVFQRERQGLQVRLAATEIADAEHSVAARGEHRGDRSGGEQPAFRPARAAAPDARAARRAGRLRMHADDTGFAHLANGDAGNPGSASSPSAWPRLRPPCPEPHLARRKRRRVGQAEPQRLFRALRLASHRHHRPERAGRVDARVVRAGDRRRRGRVDRAVGTGDERGRPRNTSWPVG